MIEQVRSVLQRACYGSLYNNFGFTAKELSEEYNRSIRNIRYSIAKINFLINKDKDLIKFKQDYINR